MRPYPFLVGGALLFWGWQSDLLWLGAAAALTLEAAHWLKARWDFTQPDLDRVWNLCVALFLGATIFAFFSGDNLTVVGDLLQENSPSSRLATLNQSKRSLFQLLQWLPIMFLPMALAQAYAAKDHFDLSTFSWWLRRKRHEPGYAQRYPGGLNVGYPFFACCLFSSCTGNQRTLWFSFGLVVLVAWALWLHRPQNFNPLAWGSSLCAALALGVGMQFGVLEVQKLLQRLDEALLARWSGSRRFDAKENQTRIGALGLMKLSGRIVFRLKSDSGPAPELLREASYTAFHSPFWSSIQRDFERVTPEANHGSWILQPASNATRTVTIAGYVPGGTGLLPVPPGVFRLDELPSLGLATNRFGGVRMEEGPGFVEVDASYRANGTIDGPPSPEDSEVPMAERPAVRQIAEALQLSRLEPKQAVRVIEKFFAEKFTYSAWQGIDHRPTPGRTALSRFLLENRSGHCEYFGTAATLLLRAAHIPARYAIGYSVQEKSGRSYIIRERHGHAWALAWIDGMWRDVDCTPAGWAGAESQQASWLEPVRDLFSRLWFEFSRWRWGHAEWKRSLLWFVVPLLVFAVGKVLLQRQWGRVKPKTGEDPASRLWPGLDSEFYAVEQRLAQAGFPRQSGETGFAWLQRVQKATDLPVRELGPLMAAHYRLRFHPGGLSTSRRMQLQKEARRWLESLTRSLP